MTAPMMRQGPLIKALRSPTPTPKQRADAWSRISTQGQHLLHQQAAALEPTPRVSFSVSSKRHLNSSNEHSEAIVAWAETMRDQMDVVGGVDMEIEVAERFNRSDTARIGRAVLAGRGC